MSKSSNYRRNKAYIEEYRKELKALLGDIKDIDVKVLNKSVNEGVKVAKENTPVDTGFMKESWSATPTKKTNKKVEKGLINTADYSSFVNDGHRQEVGRYVPAIEKTLVKPWVEGHFTNEKAISKVEQTMVVEFRKEVERVKRKHDA